MDEFLTDDEQAERTKRWLGENSVFIVAGIVIGLGSLFGWQEWQSYKQDKAGEASAIWEQLQSAIEGQRFNEVNETLELLEKDYSTTPYLDQARLALARMHMNRSEPESAIEQLELLSRTATDPQLQRIAELRLAQIMTYLERYDEALGVLGEADSSAFAGLFHDLRGDIYFAQGRLEDARTEYQAALVTAGSSSIDRSFVQMKLDDVAGSLAADTASDEAAAAAAEPVSASPDDVPADATP